MDQPVDKWLNQIAFLFKGLLHREEQLGFDLGRRGLRQDVKEQRQQLRHRHSGLLSSCVKCNVILSSMYRVTHLLDSNLPLTSKHKFRIGRSRDPQIQICLLPIQLIQCPFECIKFIQLY